MPSSFLLISISLPLVFLLTDRSDSAVGGGQLPPIVFVARGQAGGGAVPGMGPAHRTAIVGGSLMVRESNGRLRVLVDSSMNFAGIVLLDVSDPRVHWDGRRIVFAGVEHPESSWRIYEIDVDGTGLRKITDTDRSIDLSQFGAAAERFRTYDDIDPCYLPDGRILFASTRFPQVAEYGDVLATNLFAVNPDGSNLHRITTERNGAEQPTVDPVTGRIVYARWWLNVDRPSNETREGITREVRRMLVDDPANLWHAVTITPDGDDIQLYAGDLRTRQTTQSYRPLVLPDGKLLSVVTSNSALLPSAGGTGIRWFNKGADAVHHVIGAPSSLSFAADPVLLPDGRLIISYSKDGGEYGLYLCRVDGSGLSPLVDLPNSLELNADIVAQKPVPPIIPTKFSPPADLPPTEDPSTFYINDSFRFDCLNIFANADVDVPIGNAPSITRSASIKFFLNVQRQNPHGLDPSVPLRVAPVNANGGVHEHDLPADVPMFEQIVDAGGKVLMGGDGKAAHVTGLNYNRAGTGTKCVGCHAGHTLIPVPKNYFEAEWFNASTSARVSASSSMVLQDTIRFRPEYVVDRKVRLSGPNEIWVANASRNQYIELTWDVPIEAKRFVLYGIPRTPRSALGGARRSVTVTVRNCEIILYRNNAEVHRIRSTGVIRERGTIVDVRPAATIDRARVVMRRFVGEKKSLPGLAEIETIARIAVQ